MYQFNYNERSTAGSNSVETERTEDSIQCSSFICLLIKDFVQHHSTTTRTPMEKIKRH